MDDAVRAHDAAREALEDIEPDRLHDLLDGRLADASMTPSVLTFVSARALDPGVDVEGIAERAAGVQLIYEGLRLTRTLACEQPWAVVDVERTADGENREAIDADLDVVAADVLVARGFYLLARTEAADRAVETVRTFGRDQTRRHAAATPDERERLDRTLEADVFALAVVAGTTAVGVDPTAALLDYVTELARDYEETDGFPPPPVALSDGTAERLAALSERHEDPDVDLDLESDRVPSSATDP